MLKLRHVSDLMDHHQGARLYFSVDAYPALLCQAQQRRIRIYREIQT